MKKYYSIVIIISIFFAISGCNQGDENLSTDVIENSASADENSSKEEQPRIVFEKTEHDFGKVIDGEIVSYSFQFTNKGDADLVITSVDPDCGCTVADYPEEPIEPGEEGYIDVQFDSKHRQGFNHKKATVLSNAVPNKVVLELKAKVNQPHKSGI